MTPWKVVLCHKRGDECRTFMREEGMRLVNMPTVDHWTAPDGVDHVHVVAWGPEEESSSSVGLEHEIDLTLHHDWTTLPGTPIQVKVRGADRAGHIRWRWTYDAEPPLGMATTEQLLVELAVRGQVDGSSYGMAMMDAAKTTLSGLPVALRQYRTVGNDV